MNSVMSVSLVQSIRLLFTIFLFVSSIGELFCYSPIGDLRFFFNHFIERTRSKIEYMTKMERILKYKD